MSNHQKSARLLILIVFSSCQSKPETISPVIQNITESVYASGVIVSKNQYQVFAAVSGIVKEVFVDDGAVVEIGSPILFITNDAQQLTAANSQLSNEYNSLYANHGRLDEAKAIVKLTNNQMSSDSFMLERQKRLWAQDIGTRVALEQKELVYEGSTTKYASALENLGELGRQLKYLSRQAQNNLLISDITNDEYMVKSNIKGKVYQLNLAIGEIVTPQIPIAIIGDNEQYLLEMQIDEYDIVAIRLGMPVLVVLDSYRDSVFNAVVTKINPIMDVQSKTFTIEAEFLIPPRALYPNISFEANVVIRTKKEALLIPREYLLNDSIVVNKSGKRLTVKTGLKDYRMVEILSGIDVHEELLSQVE
ncbi:hypothetical protein LCGC14_1145630 [marine sediment metagenome]|uniref:HlyD family efflux transporter periplasmic adaptor subunit n=2 Tax=root TaxID=1 RepID=A0A831VPN8_9FLAO|nr:HlyD family efflux transporter periplasmic adaptor subunit [Pricia antarctica]